MKIIPKIMILIALVPLFAFGQSGYFGTVNMNFNLGSKDGLFGRATGYSITTTHGYSYKNWLGFAGGLGILHDPKDQRTFSPFFVQLSSAPLKTMVSPFAAFDIGYAYQWPKFYEDEFTSVYGGAFLHPQVGIRIGKPGGIQGVFGVGWMRMDSKTVSAGFPGDFVWLKTYKRYTFNMAVRF
jgi:hypothetical protein